MTEEAKDELEELGEDVEDYVVATSAKKRQIIQDYTKVASNNGQGVDILDDNGNLKNTYQILQEIADVYEEIQEEDKKYGTNRAQGLIEELAGRLCLKLQKCNLKNTFNCVDFLKSHTTITRKLCYECLTT